MSTSRAGSSIRGVTFLDAGTVTEDISFNPTEDIRASVGFGFRILVPAPMFQGIPISLDFGFPIMKESGDDTQLLHFDLGIRF